MSEFQLFSDSTPSGCLSTCEIANALTPRGRRQQRKRRSAYNCPRSTVNLGGSYFPVPDPSNWPIESVGWFHRAAGRCEPDEVVIFHDGVHCFAVMESAIAALTFLDVLPAEWRVGGGYPVFCFSSTKLERHAQTLAAVGFTVRVMSPRGTVASEPEIVFSVEDVDFLAHLGVASRIAGQHQERGA